MARLAFYDYHNMIAILEKSEHNFWSTARIESTNEETKILAAVDGKPRTISESSLRRHLKLNDAEGISFNEFSSNSATAVVCMATNRVYNFSKMIFDGMVRNVNTKGSKFLMYQSYSLIQKSQATILQGEDSGTPTEPHHTPSPQAQQSPLHDLSSSLHPTASTKPIYTTTPTEIPTLRQYSRRATRIAQAKTLPTTADEPASPLSDDIQREAFPTGSMQQLQDLTDLCTRLQRQQTEMAYKIKAQDLVIGSLKVRIKLLEDKDKGSAELSGDDAPIKGRSMEIGEEAGVERSIERGTVSVPPVAEVLTVGVPTVSGLVPTVSAIFTTASVVTPYSRRPREISAKDKVLRSHAGWKTKYFRGMTLEEIREKFIPVWKQIEDFVPMSSKEEAERFKRKGLRLEQGSAKRMKTSEEVSKEDLKEMMQLIPVEEASFCIAFGVKLFIQSFSHCYLETTQSNNNLIIQGSRSKSWEQQKLKANVSNTENQKKQKPKVMKPKKVGSNERLASPKPSKPRPCLRALCYPKNDREDTGKLGAKAMVFKQSSSKLGLQGLTYGHINSGLNLTYAPSIITTQKPTERELDLLFETMHDDYLGGQPLAASRTVPAAQAPQDVDELETQQQHAQHQPAIIVDNVPNPFATLSISAVESSSSQYVDPSNIHMFYQPYPHEYQWSKDHPLEQDNTKLLTLKWLFKNKHDEENTVIQNKTRLVMRGYHQEEGIDFEESFAPDSGFELTGFLDADYMGCKETFKSTSGGAQFLGERLEHVEKGTTELYFVKTGYQLADLFTKALPVDRFNYLVHRLGMCRLSPHELERLVNSRNTPLDRVKVLGMIEKMSKVKNKKIVSTEMELVLEQTQQVTSQEVSISTKGVKERKRIVKIKGVKKEALHTTLGKNQVNA
uniref:Retrovirus-related Pol polyprotein from transposon TNT 1-94 n=1 Tax=Tanacetum cinerariifolium TaxID=118510 RepID=A0A6L2N063_TANCI|nr:retrovirus-related Pol polyprotein from transposon TNT 1-94 [Tanacetum cinerariifolium]